MLKTQQRSNSERHSVFIEKTNKIALSSNDDKIKECDQLTRKKHMHMEQAKIYYVRKKKLNAKI